MKEDSYTYLKTIHHKLRQYSTPALGYTLMLMQNDFSDKSDEQNHILEELLRILQSIQTMNREIMEFLITHQDEEV